MFSRPKILFLVSLLFVALLNPKFNPYLLFKFLIFYHSSIRIYNNLSLDVYTPWNSFDVWLHHSIYAYILMLYILWVMTLGLIS